MAKGTKVVQLNLFKTTTRNKVYRLFAAREACLKSLGKWRGMATEISADLDGKDYKQLIDSVESELVAAVTKAP